MKISIKKIIIKIVRFISKVVPKCSKKKHIEVVNICQKDSLKPLDNYKEFMA